MATTAKPRPRKKKAPARRPSKPRVRYDEATQYARDVVKGRIVAGRLQILACKRHLDDLKRSRRRDFEFKFEPEKAERVYRYFDQLRHTVGEFGKPSALCGSCGKWSRPIPRASGQRDRFGAPTAVYECEHCGELGAELWPNGRPIHLEPWQKFVLASIFAWVDKTTGFRRFRNAYIQVARKNGKSTILAGLASYLAFYDDPVEMGAQVYCVAAAAKQARIVFAEATRQLQRMEAESLRRYGTRGLVEGIEILKQNINDEAGGTGSKIEPLASDHNTLDGLNTHGAIFDEFHAYTSRELFDVIETSTGSRTQSLLLEITTAGYNQETVCFEHRDFSISLLQSQTDAKGNPVDPAARLETWFAFICEPDAGDDWRDPNTWAKANPNLGVSVYPEEMRNAAEKAGRQPSALNGFKNRRLNMWTQAEIAHFDLDRWDLAEKRVELDALEGADCFAGLDLAETRDLNAFVLAFPRGSAIELFPFFWIAEDNVEDAMRFTRKPYDQWIEQGLVFTMPGDFTSYDQIGEFIIAQAERFNIRRLVFDPRGASSLQNDFETAGIEAVRFVQNSVDMAPAIDRFDHEYRAKKIRHGGNRVLRWMAECTRVREIGESRKLYTRQNKNRHKIDGIVAATMAVYHARIAGAEAAAPVNPYNRPDYKPRTL